MCRKKEQGSVQKKQGWEVGNKYVDVLFRPLSRISCTHQTSITHTSHVINCDVAHGFVFCFCLVLDSVKINKACRIKSNQVESSRIKSSIRAFGAHLRTAEHEARTAVRWGIAAAKTTDKVSSAQSGHTREQKAFLPKPPPIPSRPLLAPPRAPSRSLALPRAPSRSLARPSRPRRAPFAFPRAPSRSAKTCATVTKPPSGGYFTSFAAILAASRRQPPPGAFRAT